MSPISLLNHILHIQETYLRKVGKEKTSKGMIIELIFGLKKQMKAIEDEGCTIKLFIY
jgi:hypothetical protein